MRCGGCGVQCAAEELNSQGEVDLRQTTHGERLMIAVQVSHDAAAEADHQHARRLRQTAHNAENNAHVLRLPRVNSGARKVVGGGGHRGWGGNLGRVLRGRYRGHRLLHGVHLRGQRVRIRKTSAGRGRRTLPPLWKYSDRSPSPVSNTTTLLLCRERRVERFLSQMAR